MVIKQGFSFCIPVFGTAQYLRDLLLSIQGQEGLQPGEYEILAGCDGDPEALSTLLSIKPLIRNLHIFHDPVNRGKFITANTLASMSQYDSLVFIDSDDSLCRNDAVSLLRNRYMPGNDIISFAFVNVNAPGFVSREGECGVTIRVSGGNFLIRSTFFMHMNGFSPWRCRADGPFHTRAGRLNAASVITEEAFIRRLLRPESLLHNRQSGSGSRLRKGYKAEAAALLERGEYRLPELVINPELKEVLNP